jgi:hypothetical protein
VLGLLPIHCCAYGIAWQAIYLQSDNLDSCISTHTPGAAQHKAPMPAKLCHRLTLTKPVHVLLAFVYLTADWH